MCDSVTDMAMARAHLDLAFTLTVISLLSTPTSCKLVESIVSARENYLLKGHLIQRLQIADSLSCAHCCLRKERCRSFNFKLLSESQGLCELSSKAAGYFDDSLTGEAGWLYGQIAPIQKKFFSESDVPGVYYFIRKLLIRFESPKEFNSLSTKIQNTSCIAVFTPKLKSTFS